MILLSVRQHKSRLYDTDNDSYLAESHPSTFGEIAVGRPGQGWMQWMEDSYPSIAIRGWNE